MMASPNNILGIEYLRALQTTSSQMHAFTISRLGADYHSTDISGHIASATGIRKLISEGGNVDGLLPTVCSELLQAALDEGFRSDPERIFTALQTLLLQEVESLRGIYHVADGLEQRLVDAAMTATSYAELADAVKSRQWTLTRIQRLLTYVLLQVSNEEMRGFLQQGPMYLRLLGATSKGREVLAKARSKKSLPMISDPARAKANLRRFYKSQPDSGRMAERMLASDLRATRLYGLLQTTRQRVHRNQDFFQVVRQT